MIHSLKTKTAKKDPLFDLLLHQSVSCNILIPVITALILQFKLSLKNFDCLNRHIFIRQNVENIIVY